MAPRGRFKPRQSNDDGRGKPRPTHCKYHLSATPTADQNPLQSLVASHSQPHVFVTGAVADRLQGHHVPLQKSVSSFTGGLLETTPTVPGLDRTIVIPPRRLHLTLGVMSLEDSENSSNAQGQSRPINSSRTLVEALSLLSSLGSQISELLCGARLKVPLQTMHIMPPDGGDPDKAHVLWFGPSLKKNEDARRLQEVGELVSKTFREAGFITDRRPLKLHCTILNTTYRRPSSGRLRQPFSYRSLLHSPTAQTFLLDPRAEIDSRRPVEVNFGAWHVDQIQICKMGSYGPEGEYVSCGGLSLGVPQQ